MTTNEYKRLQESFGDPAVFDAAREQFYREHPDCPKPRPIPNLDLIMRKEYALQILRGQKTVEIRNYTEHYCNRLYDKKVLAYEDTHWDDELLRLQLLDFNDSVRAVEKIHFHDYGRTWFLDVECVDNNTVVVIEDQVQFLQDEYNYHEFDEMLADLNKSKVAARPVFFYFALGNIIASNLNTHTSGS